MNPSARACDTHVHFYDATYPSSPDALLHPPDAHADDYASVQQELDLGRLVVVQPTTYGFDNSCQLEAMARFGDCARGVMVVDADVSDADLGLLTELGVRGARFHMLPGGAVPWEALEPVSAKIAPYGWHIQLQLNGRELVARRDQLAALPTNVVIDHVGRFMPPVSVADENFTALVDLVESGRAWVKLSAPYESSANTDGVLLLIEELVARVPDRLLWATNWPHPGQFAPPTAAELAAQLKRWVPTTELREQILVTNPDLLYFT
jgi:D-galactarolactone isomerase